MPQTDYRVEVINYLCDMDKGLITGSAAVFIYRQANLQRFRTYSAKAVLPPDAIFGAGENSGWKRAHCLVLECGHCSLG